VPAPLGAPADPGAPGALDSSDRSAAADNAHDAQHALHTLFITQETLREISRHIWTAPNQEVLGFLLGQRYQAPEDAAARFAEAPYVVIRATTRSSYVIADEGDEQIPEDAWHAAYLEARRRGLTLVGWYHSTAYLDGAPTPRDLRTHRIFFKEEWQAGLLVAPRADLPTGGFFRAPRGEEGAADVAGFLPFYEVADDGSLLPDGRKRTVMPWANYVTDDPIERATRVAVVRPKMASGAIPILMPKGRPGTAPPAIKLGAARRRRPGRGRPNTRSHAAAAHRRREQAKRVALIVGSVLVAASALFGMYSFVKLL
jgi:proteasome lid subunit RPN8/RPN11